MIQAVENVTPDDMRQLVDVLRRKQETGLAVLLITAADGKVQLVAGLSKDLIERGLHAGNWLKEVAPIVGGGGGGRPDLAQAGGKSPEKIPAALEQALDRKLDRGTEPSSEHFAQCVDSCMYARLIHASLDHGVRAWTPSSRTAAVEASPRHAAPSTREPTTVLVVDDSAFDRHLIGQLLESLQGHQAASSPATARKGSPPSSASARP